MSDTPILSDSSQNNKPDLRIRIPFRKSEQKILVLETN